MTSTQIINQGTGGISRGGTYEVIMKWKTILSFLPFGKISPDQVSCTEQVDRRLGLNTREGGGGVRSSWMV